MSDNESADPALSDTVGELQGAFPNDAALQAAMGELTLAGFDHADLSMPDPDTIDSPDAAAAASDDIDKIQLRTMASGMTGVAAGTAVAGVLLATGGLAAPAIAAVAGASALGATAATSGAGVAATQSDIAARDQLGAEGKLILAVRIRTPEMAAKAETIMQQAGATTIRRITDAAKATTRGVSASSWTG